MDGAFCNSFLRNLLLVLTSAAPVMGSDAGSGKRTVRTVFRNFHIVLPFIAGSTTQKDGASFLYVCTLDEVTGTAVTVKCFGNQVVHSSLSIGVYARKQISHKCSVIVYLARTITAFTVVNSGIGIDTAQDKSLR